VAAAVDLGALRQKYREEREKYADGFKAEMGAEAIAHCCRNSSSTSCRRSCAPR